MQEEKELEQEEIEPNDLESEQKKKKMKKIRIVIQLTLLLILIVGAIVALIYLYPIFEKVQSDPAYRDYIISKLASYGGFSWILLTVIQVVQTILAFIPAGPVVMITGMMYDPWIAVILCLLGQTLGALVVIWLVKIFGYSFLSLFIDPDSSKKFKILNDGKKCGVLMFSYLLIPFLPKDPIAFIVPFTKVKIRYFIPINIIARTPMTIVTVLFGNSIISGEYLVGIIIGSCSAVLALICFIFNKRIVAFIDKITTRKEKSL